MKHLFICLLMAGGIIRHTQAQELAQQFLKSEDSYEKEILKVTGMINDPAVLDSLVNLAYRYSPKLKAFEEDMALYDEEYLQKKRNWVSSFRLGVNIFSANTTLDENSQSTTTYGVLPTLGLNLSVDPAQFVNRKSMMRQAENKKQRTFYQQEDQKLILKEQIINLFYEYLAMLEATLIRQNSLEARRQYLQVFETEFKNGNKTLDELLVIQHQVYLAEESVMMGHVQSMKKRKEIEIVLGY